MELLIKYLDQELLDSVEFISTSDSSTPASRYSFTQKMKEVIFLILNEKN